MLRRRFSSLVGGAVFILLAVVSSASARPFADAGLNATRPITIAPAFTPAQLNTLAADDWITVGGSLKDERYSTLTQINTTNVKNLRMAWKTDLGFKPALGESQQGNPLAYKGVLYVSTGRNRVYALDGATGEIIWKYVPAFPSGYKPLLSANRGVALGDGKVFMGQMDGWVVTLDQRNGDVIWRHKIGRWQEGCFVTSAVLYYEDKVLVGLSGGDWGCQSFMAALDANTGSEIWRWSVVPGPGDLGWNTWSGTDGIHGGGAIWIYSSVDPALGLLYIVTGNPIPYNGRGPGDNLFTDSIVALNIDDGSYAWHFQTVHHDNWDYDVTNPPILFEAMYGGVLRKGVGVASKTGWIYLLDRASGEPLLGIPERKVPPDDKADNYSNSSRTQPVPVGQPFIDGMRSYRRDWPGKAPDGKPFKVGPIFTPFYPSKKGSFLAVAPSLGGGVDWPPSAYSPDTQYIYVCANDGPGGSIGAIPNHLQRFVPGNVFQVVGANFGPPSTVRNDYGRITAMDVKTNTRAWSVKWKKTCYSGVTATAGRLLFAGMTERYLRAYDAASGKFLWASPRLEGGANAPSMTYTADGKQYVAIFAGGSRGKQNDTIYAFALP